MNWAPWAAWGLSGDLAQEFQVALDWSMSRVILLAPREVEWYLGEWYYRQIAHPEGFVVPTSPPRVIESEGTLDMGTVDEPIDAYLVLDVDYSEWWATQTFGPLAGPIEGEVRFICSFNLFFCYFLCFNF